jgi:hypothetical protein
MKTVASTQLPVKQDVNWQVPRAQLRANHDPGHEFGKGTASAVPLEVPDPAPLAADVNFVQAAIRLKNAAPGRQPWVGM